MSCIMYQYDLFTTTLLVLTHFSEIAEANRRSKIDDLVFWERGPETTTPTFFQFQFSEPSSGYSYQHKKRKLRRNMHRFIQALRRSGPEHNISRKNVAFESISQTSKSKTRVKLAQETEKLESATTKKKKNYTSESEEKDRLVPYSILDVIKSDVIPKFEDVNITVEVLGRTLEYNDIVLMKATQASEAKTFRSEKVKYSEDAPEKKIIFIVHGLSTAGFAKLPCLSEVESFLTLVSYYFKHLDKFDIFLIPIGNPDGVAMARLIISMHESIKSVHWNKNVSPQKACPGVAVDRNFDVAWNESHDENTCSQYYPGVMPFSEIESVAVRDTFHKYSHRILGYMHVHAGTFITESFKGDAVLYPKGFTEMQSDDDKYVDLKGEIEETMKNASFKVISVTVDTLFNWYGKVTGSSVDYASTIYGIPYAMELVMQLYADDRMESDSDERETHAALTEIWQRVLNAIFETMYRSYKKNFDDA